MTTNVINWPLLLLKKQRTKKKEEKNKYREKRLNNYSSRAQETIALAVHRLGCHPFVIQRDARSWSTVHLPRVSLPGKKIRKEK